MNEIEKHKYTIETYREAIDSITPPTIIRSNTQKQYVKTMLESVSLNDIVEKANIFYIQQNVIPYFDFYLKYLTASGETSSILTVDQPKMYAGMLSAQKGPDQTRFEICDYYFGININAWLYMQHVQHIEFFQYLIRRWKYSPIVCDPNKRNLYIKLLPADTTLHLDELARLISFYL